MSRGEFSAVKNAVESGKPLDNRGNYGMMNMKSNKKFVKLKNFVW